MKAKKLHILWTNDNLLTTEHMVFMYATNSLRNGWWETVHIIIWGATTKLACENTDVHNMISTFIAEGGKVSACKRCAEKMKLLDTLRSVPGVDVYYVGETFTEILRGQDTVITI